MTDRGTVLDHDPRRYEGNRVSKLEPGIAPAGPRSLGGSHCAEGAAASLSQICSSLELFVRACSLSFCLGDD